MVILVTNMTEELKLSIASYNSRGFNLSKQQYTKELLSKCSVLFLQEHWLADSQLPILGSINDDFLFTGVSGFGNTNILSGRPYGGCAILWRSDIQATVNVLDVDSNRVCAMRLCNDVYRFLFICVYMPYEGSESMTDEFADQLAMIENIIEANSDCHVIIGGDFNVDLTRPWMHTSMLTSFCDSNGLCFGTSHQHSSVDYTYQFNMSRFSIIDHFLLSKTLFTKAVDRVCSLHDTDNMSDHEPVVLHLSVKFDVVQYVERIRNAHISWAKANNDDCTKYRHLLSQLLDLIEVPTGALLCTDGSCCDSNHIKAVNKYATDIGNACSHAADSVIPHTCSRKQSRCAPGWSEHVQPLREKSIFWHRLWVECGLLSPCWLCG